LNGRKQQIPANLQQFSGLFADLARHAGKTCRFAGFFNFRPKLGKMPADLQAFLKASQLRQNIVEEYLDNWMQII